MKKNKLFIWMLLVMLPLASCQQYIKNFEKSPNDASTAPVGTIFKSALIGTILAIEGEDARRGAIWAQQFSGVDRQYAALDVYTTVSVDYDWATKYYAVIEQANQAIARANGNNKLIGIMNIIKAQTYGFLTSHYGNIPFTESNTFPAIKAPKYDDQVSVVYPGVQALLDQGITSMAGVGTVTATDDFMLGGNASRWIAVANTLKARYFLHVGNYTSALAAATAGISSAANNLQAIHTNGVQSQDINIWYDFLINQRNGYMDASGSVVRQMLTVGNSRYKGNSKTNETARLNALFTGTDPNTDTSPYFQATSSFPLVTYEENQLIIAECQGRAGNLAAAITALNNVRNANGTLFSGSYTNYVLADFQAGGIARGTASTDAQAVLNEVYKERYCTLIGQTEAFNDLRRLNNPMGLTPKLGTQFPQRFLYPQTEINSNPNIPSPLPGVFDKTKANGGTI